MEPELQSDIEGLITGAPKRNGLQIGQEQPTSTGKVFNSCYLGYSMTVDKTGFGPICHVAATPVCHKARSIRRI